MFEPCNHLKSEWSMIIQVNMSWIGLLLLATIVNYTYKQFIKIDPTLTL